MSDFAATSPPASPPNGDQSKTDAAKSAAADVAGGAKEAAASVADTATEQAKDVAAQTKTQARDLLGEGRTQFEEQARKTQSSAASSLGALAGELRRMSDADDANGTASELVRQASDRAEGLAAWLRDREPGDALEEIRAFARRKPGTFLLGAALAGVAAGRLTRGAVAAAHDDTPAGQPDAVPSTAPPYPPAPLVGYVDAPASAASADDEWAAPGRVAPAGGAL